MLLHTVLIRPNAHVPNSDFEALTLQTARLAERLCGAGNAGGAASVGRGQQPVRISGVPQRFKCQPFISQPFRACPCPGNCAKLAVAARCRKMRQAVINRKPPR